MIFMFRLPILYSFQNFRDRSKNASCNRYHHYPHGVPIGQGLSTCLFLWFSFIGLSARQNQLDRKFSLFCWISRILVFWPGPRDQYISPNPRGFCASYSLGLILVCAYTIRKYGQTCRLLYSFYASFLHFFKFCNELFRFCHHITNTFHSVAHYLFLLKYYCSLWHRFLLLSKKIPFFCFGFLFIATPGPSFVRFL